MDQAAQDRIKREIEDDVRTLLPGRRGAPGRVAIAPRRPAHRAGRAAALPDPHRTPRTAPRTARARRRQSRNSRGHPRPGTQAVPVRAWPGGGLRSRTSGSGSKMPAATSRGGLVMALDDQGGAADSDITHVMVRLKAAGAGNRRHADHRGHREQPRGGHPVGAGPHQRAARLRTTARSQRGSQTAWLTRAYAGYGRNDCRLRICR